MKFLVLGDIFPSSLVILKKKIPLIIKKSKIDFVIANGENAAYDAKGLTIKTAKFLFDLGIDVLTSGNHIWDKKEILKYIKNEKRLLRPLNMSDDLPGAGINTFSKKNKRICVINLMTNYFMHKSKNVFAIAQDLINKFHLKRDADYIIVDVHGEFAGEKMTLGHLFDGKSTLVFGSHTHIPTSDAMILSNGTAYQTDLGMCGDYNSVIGLDKKIFLISLSILVLCSINFEYNGVVGGGIILKLSNILFDNQYLIFPAAFFGIYFLLYFTQNTFPNYILVILLLITFNTGYFIFQKYLEPMFYIIFLNFFDKYKISQSIKKNNYIIVIYFSIYYFTSNYIYFLGL